ncbi:4185_t:CDS:2, partial [Cetraspora pellucida]
MSSPPFSDNEESNVTPSMASTSSTTSRKKRKANAKVVRSNKSHTSFFFSIDKDNAELAYCKICVHNFAGSRQTPYPYTRKGGNTSNMIAHLRDKHNITKDNYTDHLDEHNEPKCDQSKVTDYYNNTASPCLPQRQQLIMRKLIQFIIRFVQPLYILQDQSFREFVYACELGFRSLISSNATAIHLSTDLWTAKSCHGYLGVTATWLSSEFKFREALISCDHLEYPHSGDVICEELIQLIREWRLDSM